MPKKPLNVRCPVKNADGTRCKAWAARGTDPPRCSAHAGRNLITIGGNGDGRSRGFYDRRFTREELADLVTLALDDTLEDEIAAARVALRRVFAQLEREDLDADKYARLAALTFDGVRTIARLQKDRQSLVGEEDAGIAGVLAKALDELAREYDIEV